MKRTNFIACIILIVAGVAIAFCGLYATPMGAISPTVLEATGVFLVIAGGFAGLVVDFDFKRLRFFVGLPEHYQHSEKQSGKHETTTSGLPDLPDTP
jgi:hypothetical protein